MMQYDPQTIKQIYQAIEETSNYLSHHHDIIRIDKVLRTTQFLSKLYWKLCKYDIRVVVVSEQIGFNTKEDRACASFIIAFYNHPEWGLKHSIELGLQNFYKMRGYKTTPKKNNMESLTDSFRKMI